MQIDNPKLWEDLSHYSFEDPTSSLTILRRLSMEHGWPLEYARRVTDEYKKFVYLAVMAGHKVTPSDEVDQVWHLHMIYTEEYWDNFCTNILHTKLHHGPTKGGKNEDIKFDDWYSKTKDSYRRIFGTEPPEDIWPDNAVRFGRRFVRINVHDHVVIFKDDYPLIVRIIVLMFKIRTFFQSIMPSFGKGGKLRK
jgi:hypothetical protein